MYLIIYKLTYELPKNVEPVVNTMCVLASIYERYVKKEVYQIEKVSASDVQNLTDDR